MHRQNNRTVKNTVRYIFLQDSFTMTHGQLITVPTELYGGTV